MSLERWINKKWERARKSMEIIASLEKSEQPKCSVLEKHRYNKLLLSNGNPFQYSCLENPTDGGAWWAAVSGVAQSPTRLK